MPYKYKKPDKTRTASLAVAGVFIVGALWFFFLSPAFTGLAVLSKATAENKNIDDYLRGLDSVKAELKSEIASCGNQSSELTNKLIECTNNLARCGSEKFSLNSTFTSLLEDCKTQVGEINQTTEKEITGLKSQLDKKSGEYDLLVNNTARSNCCKAKIDNPGIKFFKVENNKVVCSEENGIELNCTL